MHQIAGMSRTLTWVSGIAWVELHHCNDIIYLSVKAKTTGSQKRLRLHLGHVLPFNPAGTQTCQSFLLEVGGREGGRGGVSSNFKRWNTTIPPRLKFILKCQLWFSTHLNDRITILLNHLELYSCHNRSERGLRLCLTTVFWLPHIS